MATPHVAGALSIALRTRGLLVSDEMAAEKLRQETVANGGSVVTAGIVGDAKSPNNLLLSMVGLTGTRAPTAAPTNAPTETPTTAFPTSSPVEQPTASDAPTSAPTPVPTQAPTNVDSLSSCVNRCTQQAPSGCYCACAREQQIQSVARVRRRVRAMGCRCWCARGHRRAARVRIARRRPFLACVRSVRTSPLVCALTCARRVRRDALMATPLAGR